MRTIFWSSGGIRYSVRKPDKAARVQKLAEKSKIVFQPFTGDVRSSQFVKELCSGCGTLLHIAGIHSSRTVVRAAAEAGVRRMILVHTTGIYSKYKYAGEEYRKTDSICRSICGEHHIALTILRPTMIYGSLKDGNVSVFLRMVDKLPVVPTVNGAHYELQPVWCRDLGTGYFQCLMEGRTAGHDYNLSGGEPVELRRMFEVMAEQLGVRRTFISCPYPVAYAGAWAIYILTCRRMDYREKVQRLVEPRVYSHEDAERDFGYHPVNFETGVREEILEYKKYKAGKQK